MKHCGWFEKLNIHGNKGFENSHKGQVDKNKGIMPKILSFCELLIKIRLV